MLTIVRTEIDAVEADPTVVSRQGALMALSNRLGLDDFGEVLIAMPNPAYPKLSQLLPAMASNEVQDRWTGLHGTALLRQTAVFVRSLTYNFTRIAGQNLSGATILDYGCGYGRILRLMWYFTSLSNVYGVDPWTRSIEECNLAGIHDNVSLSDYLPESLPVNGATFDLSYAFSVFTHLSKEAALKAFAAVRRHAKVGSIFAITIRPVEYWTVGEQMYHSYEASTYIEKHNADGFSFFAHQRNNPKATYGDASMTLEWLTAHAKGWEVAAIDRSLEDDYQVYVFLRAVA